MPLNIIVSLLCYLTNPVACLFADDVGDLPGIWKYWQTWDDSLDVEFFVKQKAPSFLRYDFDAHYISGRESTPELAAVGRDRGCVFLKPGTSFTMKERIQRYCCRVLWLTRNCAYGFGFYFFGRPSRGTDIVIKHCIDTADRKFVFAYDGSKSVWTRPWILAVDVPIVGRLRTDIFIGWKMDYHNTTSQSRMAMIANRIWFDIE